MRPLKQSWSVLIVALAVLSAGVVAVARYSPKSQPTVAPTTTSTTSTSSSSATTTSPGAATVVAVGDIACEPSMAASDAVCHSAQTANLTASLHPAAVLVLGDVQYESGKIDAYRQSYDQTWGRFNDIVHPALGNHDGAGYYAYFGAKVHGDQGSYYSFDVGSWHLISLNSEACALSAADCAPGSAQWLWLQADLAAHPAQCTLAYWHHPRFTSSSVHPDEPSVDPLWRLLSDARADVVLTGHNHQYERFAPQTPEQQPNPAGIAEFVVGTGGRSLYSFRAQPEANSQARYSGFGVLDLKLGQNSYSWQFLDQSGRSQDSGSTDCH